MQFSKGKYSQSILNEWNCLLLNIIHAISHSQLLLQKYVVVSRGIRYVPNAANIELTEINNTFKYLGGDKCAYAQG